MALDLYWYDFVCFGIVVFSVVGSIWVLLRKEGCRETGPSTIYESLVGNRPQRSVGCVRESDLWKSCWRGVSPFCLMCVRFVSCLIMLGFMCWDVYDWTSSIYAYYTEWTFTLVIVYFVLGTVTSAYGCWLHSTKPETQGERETYQFAGTDLEESRSVGTVTYLTKSLKSLIWVRGHNAENELNERAGFFGYVLQALYQFCIVFFFFTDMRRCCCSDRRCVLVCDFSVPVNCTFQAQPVDGMHAQFEFLLHSGRHFSQQLEISVVQIIIFCPLEFSIRYLPMGHARLRPDLVALPFPATVESMGTFVVLPRRIISPSLLWTVCANRTSKIYHFSKIISKCIFALGP